MAGGPLTVGPLLGLISAFSWGAGDFCGGLISRYASVLAAILVSQALGLLGAIVLTLVAAEPLPSNEALAWSVAAGASGVCGLGFFYFALSRGTMGVIAPLAALIGAGLPVLLAIAGGEPADAFRLTGIALALVAVVLISLPGGEISTHDRRARRIDLAELPLVVFSGLGFAGFFVFIDRATAGGATWWPQVAVRVTGSALAFGFLVILVVARRQGGDWRRRTGAALGVGRLRASGHRLLAVAPLFALAGAGDLGGNTFFLFAKSADAFSVAVVLSSFYPVVTTILAVVFLRERLRPAQLAGVILAALAIPLLR